MVRNCNASNPRRLLWIVNHQTLLRSEVPLLRQLGFEVFVPKILPAVSAYRSGAIESAYDSSLLLPTNALRVLNAHEFYEQPWGATLETILNRYFDGLITTLTGFTTPLFEAIRKFDGLVVARVFGREAPETYSAFFASDENRKLLDRIETMGRRFVFGQAYNVLAEVEDRRLANCAQTIAVPATRLVLTRADEWRGGRQVVLLLCPSIQDNGYYQALYGWIKAIFGKLPHLIFGRQNGPTEDPAVLPWLTDGELLELYSQVAVFAYPSREPRHVHYSPVEAMTMGCPVLYMKGALLDRLAGAELPGRCRSDDEMITKTKRLLNKDYNFAKDIRDSQRRIADLFRPERAYKQWSVALADIAPSERGKRP
jgi:hypothetical protein